MCLCHIWWLGYFIYTWIKNVWYFETIAEILLHRLQWFFSALIDWWAFPYGSNHNYNTVIDYSSCPLNYDGSQQIVTHKKVQNGLILNKEKGKYGTDVCFRWTFDPCNWMKTIWAVSVSIHQRNSNHRRKFYWVIGKYLLKKNFEH